MTAAASIDVPIGYRFSRIPEELRSEVDREVARITAGGTADLEGVEDVIIRYLPSDLSRRVEDAMQLVHPLTHDCRELVPLILKYLTPADVANLRKVNSFFRKHINAAHEHWGDVADQIVPSRRIHDFTFRAPGLRPRAEYQTFAKTALAKLRRQYGLTMTSPPPSLAYIEALRDPSRLPDGLSLRVRTGFKLLRSIEKIEPIAYSCLQLLWFGFAFSSSVSLQNYQKLISSLHPQAHLLIQTLFYFSPLIADENKGTFGKRLLGNLIFFLYLKTIGFSSDLPSAVQLLLLTFMRLYLVSLSYCTSLVVLRAASKLAAVTAGHAMTRLANRLLDVRRP